MAFISNNEHHLGGGSVVRLNNGNSVTLGEYVGGMGAHYQQQSGIVRVSEIKDVLIATPYTPNNAAYNAA